MTEPRRRFTVNDSRFDSASQARPFAAQRVLRALESRGNAPILFVSTQHERVLAAESAPLAARFASMRWDADMVLAALADVKSP